MYKLTIYFKNLLKENNFNTTETYWIDSEIEINSILDLIEVYHSDKEIFRISFNYKDVTDKFLVDA